VGQHGSASGSILLNLGGFEVLAAEVVDQEWRLAVQSLATTVGCTACGSQARPHARRTVPYPDRAAAMGLGPHPQPTQPTTVAVVCTSSCHSPPTTRAARTSKPSRPSSADPDALLC
jgi:hypothetical protein